MHHLLLVDDELAMLRGLEFHLQGDTRYAIQTASDPMTANKLLTSNEFDLVVTDLMMPHISNGLEVVHTAKQQWYEPSVLVMTAFESVENAVNAMKSGADDFISKGFGLDEISLRIDNMIKKKMKMNQLSNENRILKETIQKQFSDYQIVGTSTQTVDLIKRIQKIALDAKATCLIHGESGSGKDLVARAIHLMSPRREAPFVPINCAAIPEHLIESELFGHEKGAYTGAYTSQSGRFEQAKGGIVFLDEIGDLPLTMQKKLLRVLEERNFCRLGGKTSIDVDVMIIAASNKNLQTQVETGQFREDLFYRLNVINVWIPPLRERREDIRLLAQFFLNKFNHERNRDIQLSNEALHLLEAYNFPGNVRELRNIIEDAFVFCDGPLIKPEDLTIKINPDELDDTALQPYYLRDFVTNGYTYREALEKFESIYFGRILDENYWNIQMASSKAGLTREWVSKKVKRLGLKKRE
jgi:DNA-binding NtrC family response regulator